MIITEAMWETMWVSFTYCICIIAVHFHPLLMLAKLWKSSNIRDSDLGGCYYVSSVQLHDRILQNKFLQCFFWKVYIEISKELVSTCAVNSCCLCHKVLHTTCIGAINSFGINFWVSSKKLCTVWREAKILILHNATSHLSFALICTYAPGKKKI